MRGGEENGGGDEVGGNHGEDGGDDGQESKGVWQGHGGDATGEIF